MSTDTTTAPGALRRAEAGPTMATRLRTNRVGLTVVILFIALVAFMVVAARGSDTTPMSVNNAAPEGARAFAQILGDHHVDVRQIDKLAAARVPSPSDTMVAIVDADLLLEPQLESLRDYPGDLLLVGASSAVLEALDLEVVDQSTSLDGTVTARCDDPDAEAAERIVAGSMGLRSTGDAMTMCFTTADGASFMARGEHQDRTITAVTSSAIFSNSQLTEEGHAALALRTAGVHPDLIWYVATGLDRTLLTWTGGGGGSVPPESIEALPDYLPPGTGSAIYALAIALIFVAVWRGRRFGPLIREPLPVVVRASESTRGRARLYRKVRAHGRAGAALRAAAALRMARRIGVPRSASKEALVAAVTRATTRSEAEITHVLYGPTPHSDAELMALIKNLDSLESEVHRP